jgi:hypothetical protein
MKLIKIFFIQKKKKKKNQIAAKIVPKLQSFAA